MCIYTLLSYLSNRGLNINVYILWWFRYVWPIESATTIGVCGLVGGSASMCRWALKASGAQAPPPVGDTLF